MRIDSIADSTFPRSIRDTVLGRSGIDRAIWIALLVVVLTIIFSISLMQLALGILAVLWLIALAGRSQKSFRSTPLDIPMLVFITARIVSVIFSVDPQTSVQALYIEIIFYATFFVFTNTVPVGNNKEMNALIQLFVWTAIFASVIGMYKFAVGLSDRASSTTSGSYAYSLYLVAVLPLVLFLARDRQVFRTPSQAHIAAAVVILGVIFSLNRMYWIVMAGTLVVAAIVKRDRSPLVIYVCGMAAFILVVPSVAHRFQLTLELLSHSSDRNILWRGAAMIYARHPIVGFGPRTFGEIFPLTQQLADKGTGSWHNDFLQVYMESGLLGLIPLCWLVTATLYWGLRTLRSHAIPPQRRRTLLPFLVSIIIFFIAGGMRDTVVGIVFRFDLAVIALMATDLSREGLSSNRARLLELKRMLPRFPYRYTSDPKLQTQSEVIHEIQPSCSAGGCASAGAPASGLFSQERTRR